MLANIGAGESGRMRIYRPIHLMVFVCQLGEVCVFQLQAVKGLEGFRKLVMQLVGDVGHRSAVSWFKVLTAI
jgi:hypothetical protein